jgi:hypothetical protein
MPAVDDRPRVDRHDLAGTEVPLTGDAMDDLVVDRDAHAGRERPAGVDPGVALERGCRAGLPDVGLGEGIEWAVETPGRISASMMSRISPTTRPARRIRSISERDLRVTIVRPPGVEEGVHQRLGDRVDPELAVDGGQDAVIAVVLDDIEEGRDLLGHPGADRLLRVIGALHQGRAVEVADEVARRIGDEVVDVAVGCADAPVGHPLDEVLERDVDVGGAVDPAAGPPPAQHRAPRPGPWSAGSRRGSPR